MLLTNVVVRAPSLLLLRESLEIITLLSLMLLALVWSLLVRMVLRAVTTSVLLMMVAMMPLMVLLPVGLSVPWRWGLLLVIGGRLPVGTVLLLVWRRAAILILPWRTLTLLSVGGTAPILPGKRIMPSVPRRWWLLLVVLIPTPVSFRSWLHCTPRSHPRLV